MYFHYFAPENQEKSPFQNIEKHEAKSQLAGASRKNSRFVIFVDLAPVQVLIGILRKNT